jgi:hypothetical protein
MTILATGAYDFPAAADRNRNSLMLQAGVDSNPLAVIDGVHTGMALSKTTGMGFQIGPGRAAVNGASSADGTFTAAITAPEVGAFEPGDATKDRIDLIVLQTYPNNPATSGVKVEVVKGPLYNPTTGVVDGGGNQTVPNAPAGSLPLFRVPIPAGVSAANGGWNPSKAVDTRRVIGIPEFKDYTPTWGNFANLGSNYVSRGRYRVDGDKVSVHVWLEGGAGASLGDHWLLFFSLPIPSKEGWIYSGKGSLHHPRADGLAYQIHVLSAGGGATIHAIANTPPMGALVGPGSSYAQYPFGQGTVISCQLEYFIEASTIGNYVQ